MYWYLCIAYKFMTDRQKILHWNSYKPLNLGMNRSLSDIEKSELGSVEEFQCDCCGVMMVRRRGGGCVTCHVRLEYKGQ